MNFIWDNWRYRMSKRRLLATALGALVGFVLSTQVQAQTEYPIDGGRRCTFTPSPGMPLSFGNTGVPSNAPIGANIGASIKLSVFIYCEKYLYTTADRPLPKYSAGHLFNFTPRSVTVNSMVKDVWNTNIPGVGVRVKNDDRNVTLSTYSSGSTTEFSGGIWAARSSVTDYSLTATFTLQLVKTANAIENGGSINMPLVVDIGAVTNGAYRRPSTPLTVSIGNSQVVPATCSVTTANLNVTLPTVAPSRLIPVGTMAGKTPFNINLSCPTSTNVFITLTDATMAGNRSDILSLAPESSVTGAGLRLQREDGTSISYGPDSPVPGNMNQWRVGQKEGAASIPLSVQYISTGAITPGSVRARATFTMSYQ